MAASWMTAGLASRGRRLISAAVAILIGVGFLTTSMVVLATAEAGMEDAVAGGLRESDLVVTGVDGAWVDTADLDRISTVDGVADASGTATVWAERAGDSLVGTSLPGGAVLLQGRVPGRTGEIAVNTHAADGGLAVGDTVTVTSMTPEGEPGPQVDLAVVGVIDAGPMHALSLGEGFAATDPTLRQIDPALGYEWVQVELDDGADVGAAREALAQAVPSAEVLTGPEAAAAKVAMLTGDTAVLSAVLLGFGGVALLTAAIVIANTFTITLAQRTAELALLRCVGATRSQVRRSVLLEAVALGVVASVVGVGVGIGVAALLLELARRLDVGMPIGTGLQAGLLELALPVVIGLVVTVLASLWPAARATRVSPLAALRPSGEPATAGRVSVLRLGLSVLLLGGGTALMLLAASTREVLLGVAGGLVSFLGVLLAAVVIVPAAVRALGVGARLGGVPGRLAVAGAVRNPGRAAATSAALVVGVTLITMTSVGAASGQRTALGEIDKEFALDLVVSGLPEDGSAGQETLVPRALDPALAGRVDQVDGVRAAVAVDTAYLTVELGTTSMTSQALALGPDVAPQVLRSQELVDAVVPGSLGLSDIDIAMNGLAVGDTATVSGPGGSRELTVTELGVGGSRLAMHPDDLAALAPDTARAGTLLVRLDDGADVGTTVGDISAITDEDDLFVEGAAAMRAQVAQVLDVMVLVATALLGVAVVIAVVGIANTLSLSVIERRREHALLRGLGLTRGQLRGMLLVEGVLLALVSAGIGLALGVGYAALGIQTLLPPDTPVALAIPWGRVGIIVGVALLAGVLASVLPTRRAARVSPAEGLVTA